MTSVLNVDTIAAKDGTSPVALTKQVAPKAVFGMNLSSTTYVGVTQNSLPSNTLNISSGTDAGNGLARGNYTTNMAGLQNIYPDGHIAANNTMNVDIGVTTTALLACQQHDADTSNDINSYGFCVVFGDLA
tara:strand:- start:31 stop:423 length:393 start_codon:yes stop_codon:yes gene_type:complete